MVLTTVVFASVAAVSQGQQSGQPLINKMMTRYSQAESASGTIQQVVTVGSSKVTMNINVDYVRAEKKIKVNQFLSGATQKQFLLQCDGSVIAMTSPRARDGFQDWKKIVWYTVAGRNPDSDQPYNQNFGEIYSSATKSLASSTSQDIVVNLADHMRFLTAQIVQPKLLGEKELNGETVSVVRAGFRQVRTSPVTGEFEFWISDEGDLKKLVHREGVRLDQIGDQVIVTEELVNVKVDAKIDAKKFAFQKRG